jgi:hypothetical protein
MRPGLVEDAVRRWRVQVRDDIARLEQREEVRQRRHGIAHVNHHRQLQRRSDRLRPPQRFHVVLAGYRARQPRLHANDEVAMRGDDFLRGLHVNAADVHQLAVGQDARARNVQQNANPIGRALGCVDHFVNAVNALRARVDH